METPKPRPRARSIAASFTRGLAARGGDRDRKLGGFALDRVAPMVVVIAHFEQAVARAQRALQRRDAAGMLAVDREHQPVEEAPPLGGRAHEQPVHRGRQPHHAQMIAEGGGRADRLAVDAAAPAGRRLRRAAHRCRCRAWPAPARPRPRRIPPRSRRPGCRRRPPAWRGAGRGPATETRSPPGNWSCRRRSARPARPCRRRVCRLAAR